MDEVELDVVPLDICGIVLGSPYLYDWRAVFYREQNRYHLFKVDVEYIVRAHRMKTNLALVATSQMKMIVNASRNFALMAVKGESLVEHGIKLIKGVPEYGALLQGPESLSPNRDVHHEVRLQQSMPLPNLGMNRMVIQKTVHDYCKAWGEQLQHMQCIKSPFETCFCYLLKSHVDFSFGTEDVGHHDAKKAVQQIV